MNYAKVAAALNTISLAFGELAEALGDDVAETVPEPHKGIVDRAAAPVEIEPFAEVAEEIFPEPAEGSLSQCPKHHKPYLDGTYGLYCSSVSDDPAWSNRKGYCRITPKNAAAWLRIQAA